MNVSESHMNSNCCVISDWFNSPKTGRNTDFIFFRLELH